MSGISYTTTRADIEDEVASVLHSPDYQHFSPLPLNFHVHLFRDKRHLHGHSGCGALTLPTEPVGSKFLAEFGGSFQSRSIVLGGRPIIFRSSNRALRQDIVGEGFSKLPSSYLN